MKSTSPLRTMLQPFETSSVQLEDLHRDTATGTYLDGAGEHQYAPIAGKVYPVKKTGTVWHMIKDKQEGPALVATADKQWVIDPDLRGLRYGKAVSKMHNQYVASYQARQVLNIEARGMTQIRALFPARADMLVRGLDMARFYAFNCLHNLGQLKTLRPGTRLDTFLKELFDIDQVDASLLTKLKDTIVPICNALVDPDNDLLDDHRFVVGTNKDALSDVVAFTDLDDPLKRVHFTEHFFVPPKLHEYEAHLTQPFEILAHSHASTIIHELSHQAKATADIVYVEARRPFLDLVETVTQKGQHLVHDQIEFQRNSLSLRTPRGELFSKYFASLNVWLSFDADSIQPDVYEEILDITNSNTLDEARNAFLDTQDPKHRINIILHNADSVAHLITVMGRQLDPVPVANP